MIFVGGGNTFFLLQELKRSGADKIIAQEVAKGKFYIGESAGAIAACPDIGYSAVMDVRKRRLSWRTIQGWVWWISM